MKPFATVFLLAIAGCLEFSPHELPRDAADRDVHQRSLDRLAAAPAKEPLRFAVVGDTQQRFDDARDAVASLNDRDDLAFVVQVGDFTHLGMTFEFEAMNRIFRDLSVPYFVVAGNHDLVANGQWVYESMFGPLDTAFTYGGVRFILLNSNSRTFGFPPDVPDVAWLASQLETDRDDDYAALESDPGRDRAVVLAHASPRSSDFRADLRAPYYASLREGGDVVSIHGHGHDLVLEEEEGIPVWEADSVDHRSYLVVTAPREGGFEVAVVRF